MIFTGEKSSLFYMGSIFYSCTSSQLDTGKEQNEGSHQRRLKQGGGGGDQPPGFLSLLYKFLCKPLTLPLLPYSNSKVE